MGLVPAHQRHRPRARALAVQGRVPLRRRLGAARGRGVARGAVGRPGRGRRPRRRRRSRARSGARAGPTACSSGPTCRSPRSTGRCSTRRCGPASCWSAARTRDHRGRTVGLRRDRATSAWIPSRTRRASSLTDLGEDCPDADTIVAYDWRTGRVDVLPRGGGYDVALDPADWDYRVLAPVLANGIAVDRRSRRVRDRGRQSCRRHRARR